MHWLFHSAPDKIKYFHAVELSEQIIFVQTPTVVNKMAFSESVIYKDSFESLISTPPFSFQYFFYSVCPRYLQKSVPTFQVKLNI